MIQPVSFRFIVRSPLGAYKKTVTRDASYVLNAGFKASVTPEGICEEMTLTARNGAHPLDGTPGLGLQFADLITLQMTVAASPTESDWVSLYYGQLRQGGNPYDYRGENMVFRSLAVKLRATPTPDKGYPQMDAGALARLLVQDTLNSGVLGTTGTIGTLSVGTGPQLPSLISCISYDASAIPDLGFTITLKATNRQPLGVLLDTIVETGKTAGINLRWGVRADGVLTLRQVSTVEVAWPAETVEWKEPVAEVMYTGVLWSIERRTDNTWLRYLSVAPEAATYGVEIKPLALGTGVKPWQPLPITPSITGASITTPSASGANVVIADDDAASTVAIANPVGSASISLTVPAGGADRLYVDAQQISGGGVAFILLQYPNGQTISVRANDPDASGFTKAAYRSLEGVLQLGLPAGTVVTLSASISSPGTASSLLVKDFHLDRLNTTLLDGLAKFHYQLPASAPGDLYRTGLLLPTEYGGKIRTPRPNGEADYTANVSLWEYSVWDQGGVRTAAKTGDPDDPAAVAQASLIKRGDVIATSNALNAP